MLGGSRGGSGRNRKGDAHAQRMLAADAVGARQPLRAHVVLGRDRLQRLAAPDLVAHGQVHLRQARALGEFPGQQLALAARQAHGGHAALAGHGVPDHGRIEQLEFLERALGQLGETAQVDRALERDLVELHRLVQRHLVETVLAGVAGDREHRHELRHVVLGLAGQVQVPVVGGALALDRAQHRAFAGVVRSQRQRPVAEDAVEVLQVARGGHRGLLGILALVHPLVHVEPEHARGGAQELPRADGGGVGSRMDVETALHEHQVNEIRGQALLLEDRPEQVHVAARPLEPALERRAAVAGEELDVAVDVGVELRLHRLGRGSVEHAFVGFVARLDRPGLFLLITPGAAEKPLVAAFQFVQLAADAGIRVARERRANLGQGAVGRQARRVSIAILAQGPGPLVALAQHQDLNGAGAVGRGVGRRSGRGRSADHDGGGHAGRRLGRHSRGERDQHGQQTQDGSACRPQLHARRSPCSRGSRGRGNLLTPACTMQARGESLTQNRQVGPES